MQKRQQKKPNGITMLELRLMSCRFIISDENKPVRYCGETAHNASYCKHHYSICYYPPKKKLNLKGLV